MALQGGNTLAQEIAAAAHSPAPTWILHSARVLAIAKFWGVLFCKGDCNAYSDFHYTCIYFIEMEPNSFI